MNRFEMLNWIHETLGEFKAPSLLNISTPHGWEWSNGIFRPLTPDYTAIYRSDYCDYVNRLKAPEVKE